MFNARQMIAYFLFLLLYLFFLCIWGCLPLVCIANSTGWKLCRGLTFAQHQTILIRQSMEVMEVEIKSDCHWHKAGVYIVLLVFHFVFMATNGATSISDGILSLRLQMVAKSQEIQSGYVFSRVEGWSPQLAELPLKIENPPRLEQYCGAIGLLPWQI